MPMVIMIIRKLQGDGLIDHTNEERVRHEYQEVQQKAGSIRGEPKKEGNTQHCYDLYDGSHIPRQQVVPKKGGYPSPAMK